MKVQCSHCLVGDISVDSIECTHGVSYAVKIYCVQTITRLNIPISKLRIGAVFCWFAQLHCI